MRPMRVQVVHCSQRVHHWIAHAALELNQQVVKVVIVGEGWRARFTTGASTDGSTEGPMFW